MNRKPRSYRSLKQGRSCERNINCNREARAPGLAPFPIGALRPHRSALIGRMLAAPSRPRINRPPFPNVSRRPVLVLLTSHAPLLLLPPLPSPSSYHSSDPMLVFSPEELDSACFSSRCAQKSIPLASAASRPESCAGVSRNHRTLPQLPGF